MFKVLLVDDESWVVESLKVSIDWRELGFDVVGMAYNGSEALELIRDLKPDVIFTDIRMPGINGLELIKRVSSMGLGIQFIVTSGYAEFAYAQKAMSYGAIGYCLKPFDEAEIINCLNRAKQILEKNNLVVEPEFAYIFEGNNDIEAERITKLLKNNGIDANRDELIIIASIGSEKLNLPPNTSCLTVKTGAQKWVYILRSYEFEQIKNQLKNEEYASIKGIGVSQKIRGIKELRNSVEEAGVMAYGFFIKRKKELYKAAGSDLTTIKDILNRLEEAVRNRDLTSVDKCFKDMGEQLDSGVFTIKHAYYIYNMAMSFMNRFLNESLEPFIDGYEQLAHIFDNVGQMLAYLQDSIKGQINANSTNVPVNVENKTIKDILEYVNLNFHKEISIQSLSQIFFINPSYISQLFKKEVGRNYIEYLTKIRMDHACKLLRESRLSIQQISEKSGYGDYFYFTRIFKRTIGRTPSEYRNDA